MLSIESEKRVEQFESDWDSRAWGNFDELIANVVGAERDEMLSELIIIDLEMRLRSGNSQAQIDGHLQDCLLKYPELDSQSSFHQKVRDHFEELAATPLAPSPGVIGVETVTPAPSRRESVSSRRLKMPCEFGGFTLLRKIDGGGMGMVFEAKQRSPARIVALKLIRADVGFCAELLNRFEREAELIAAISDPGVVPVLESGSVGGHYYYTMPFFRRGTLNDRIRNDDISAAEASQILLKVTRAVSSVHEVRIVHRDLKPRNILIGDDGVPRVADFGLSRHLDHSRSLSHTGQIYGTPGYIAPERLFSEDEGSDDFLADQYSLGAILYDMLCGRPPFRGTTVWETLAQAKSDSPLPPAKLNPNVDRNLNAICMKCLERRPQDRYESCSDLADDLESYLSGQPITAKSPSLLELGKSVAVRHPAKTGMAVSSVVMVAFAFVAIFLWIQLSWHKRELGIKDLLRRSEIHVANFAKASQLISERSMGWRERAFSVLRENEKLKIEDRDLSHSRNLVATASVHHDLEHVATLAKDMWSDAVAFDPSGQFLALGQNKDNHGFRVLIYQTDEWTNDPYTLWVDCKDDNEQRRSAKHRKPEDGCRKIVFSRDGARLAIGTRHGRVHLYRWDGHHAEWLSSHQPVPGVEVRQLHFSADGRDLWALSDDHKLRVVRDGTVQLSPIVGNRAVADFAACPRQNCIYLRYRQANEVLRIDRGASEPTWKLTSLRQISALAVSPEGRFLSVSCDKRERLAIVDTQRGTVRLSLAGGANGESGPFAKQCFGQGGDWIVATSSDRRVSIWDVAGRRVICSFIVAERGGIPKITASRSGPLLAVAEHLQVSVYRIAGADSLGSICHSATRIANVAIDADGSQVATVAIQDRGAIGERYVKHAVWSVSEDQPQMVNQPFIYTASPYPDTLPIAFAPGGRHLLSTDYGNRPRIIPVRAQPETLLPLQSGRDHLWIPESEIEQSTSIGMEAQERGFHAGSGGQNPSGGNWQTDHFGFPTLPDSFFEGSAKKSVRNAVYLVYKRSGQTSSTRVRVRSEASKIDSYVSNLDVPGEGSLVIYAGTHSLKTPRIHLKLELSFEGAREELVFEGALVRHLPLENQFRSLFEQEPSVAVSDFAVHRSTGRIFSVAEEESLLTTDFPDVSVRGTWGNESISHQSGRGTLSPILATKRWLISGTTFGEVFVFDAVSGELLQSAVPLDNRVQSLCQATDSSRVAVGSSDGRIHVLELPSLEESQSVVLSERSIDAMCYDDRRRWLFAGGEDGTVNVIHEENEKYELYFTIDLNLGRISAMHYLRNHDALAVLIKNETAVRIIHLNRLCGNLDAMGLLEDLE